MSKKKSILLCFSEKHNSKEGFQQYINLRASIKNGSHFQSSLVEYPNTIQIPWTYLEFLGLTDPHGLAGFMNGDGCFRINTRKSLNYRFGVSVNLGLILTQDIRDIALMRYMISYFKWWSNYCNRWSILQVSCLPFGGHYKYYHTLLSKISFSRG